MTIKKTSKNDRKNKQEDFEKHHHKPESRLSEKHLRRALKTRDLNDLGYYEEDTYDGNPE